jgi:hypothetical protein
MWHRCTSCLGKRTVSQLDCGLFIRRDLKEQDFSNRGVFSFVAGVMGATRWGEQCSESQKKTGAEAARKED